MSFFDFFLKFWWIEVLALAGIAYAVHGGFIQIGTGVLAGIVSVIGFLALSGSGLE